MIVMAPFIAGQPGSDLLAGDNLKLIVESDTSWVRLWADWPTCWPEENRIDEPYMAKLSEQIDVARYCGLKVMMTAYRTPRWAAPTDVGVSGPYGRWIKLLRDRFGPSAGAPSRIARLEVCNEPNLKTWDGTPAFTPQTVARMFVTAQRICGGGPRLGGPAMSDVGGVGALTDYTRALLAELGRLGFSGGTNWTWTHHNYQDIIRKLWDERNQAQAIRRLIAASPYWSGSYIAMTESGVIRPSAVARYGGDPDALQRDLLGLTMQQLHRENGPGENVAMICNYLLRTDPNFDTGLLGHNGEYRPAYLRWSQ
jgi:hypothetical protein